MDDFEAYIELAKIAKMVEGLRTMMSADAASQRSDGCIVNESKKHFFQTA